jgi:ribosomal protein L18E
MDLELATTDDIVNELRKRRMRFVFIGIVNRNSKEGDSSVVVAQATDRREAFRLTKLGANAFRQLNGDRIELDQEE